ncbi:MAG: type 1 glutamine amidotransferase domain-containing protein [Puia sp.]|nr:type 1 glutamine amidotransferase domain-containing protein [Puia sp.]
MRPTKILIIATSHQQLGDTGRKTGLWLEELAVPYYIFKEAGATHVLASPKGGSVPLDRKSESIIVANTSTRRFQKDPDALAELAHSIPLHTLKAEDFDAVYLTGGHGALWDFPGNEPLRSLLEDFDRQHRFIGAICHGVSALLSMKTTQGETFVKGRQLTAACDSEERVLGLTDTLPFSLESALIAAGAVYSKGPDFDSHILMDGNVITGQNSSSSKDLAKMLLVSQKESLRRTGSSVY